MKRPDWWNPVKGIFEACLPFQPENGVLFMKVVGKLPDDKHVVVFARNSSALKEDSLLYGVFQHPTEWRVGDVAPLFLEQSIAKGHWIVQLGARPPVLTVQSGQLELVLKKVAFFPVDIWDPDAPFMPDLQYKVNVPDNLKVDLVLGTGTSGAWFVNLVGQMKGYNTLDLYVESQTGEASLPIKIHVVPEFPAPQFKTPLRQTLTLGERTSMTLKILSPWDEEAAGKMTPKISYSNEGVVEAIRNTTNQLILTGLRRDSTRVIYQVKTADDVGQVQFVVDVE